MARTGVGERRGRRRLRSRLLLPELGEERFDADNSEGNSLSSSYDDMELQSRNRALDDVVFGFFMKQSLRSLKRNYSDFCNDNDVSPIILGKKCRRVVGAEKSIFSKYSYKYFVEIIKKLTKHQRFVIEQFGFGSLFMLDICDMPSEFARWVASCVEPICSQLTVQGRTIDISNMTFHVVLGLPFGGFDIQCNISEGQEFILEHFGLSSLPHITFFGNKLSVPGELSDHAVFVCFMVIALHCFLCPSSEDHVSGKYFSVLKQPDSAKDHDFSKLVYEHCMSSINQFIMTGKLKGRRQRAPLCCNYALAVRYLDCLDFGRQNVDVSAPRKNVHTSFARNLRPDIIDGIINIAENGVLNISASNKPKFQLLVTNMLEFLRNSSVRSKSAPISHGDPNAIRAENVNLVEVKPVDSKKSNGSGIVRSRGVAVQKKNVDVPVIEIDDNGTPDCMIVPPPVKSLTAPAMKPVVKVKKRSCNLVPVGDDETFISRESLKHSSDVIVNDFIVSPVSRFSLNDSQPNTCDLKIKRQLQTKGPVPAQTPTAAPGAFPNANVLVGSNGFRRRCSMLSIQADRTYNNLLNGQRAAVSFASPPGHLPGYNNVEQPLNVIVNGILSGRFKHAFVNFVMSRQNPPLQLNNRFFVSDEDIINYSAIVELGHNPLTQK